MTTDARRHAARSFATALAFLLPTLAALAVFRLLPGIQILKDSLTLGLPGSLAPPEFVGLDNYRRLFDSESFLNSLQQTLVFNAIINPLQVVIALLLAFLLTRQVWFAGLWRTLLLVPVMVPVLGSTILWGIALRPTGPVNGLIEAVGGEPQPFLTSPDQVQMSLILIASWVGIGYWMLFLIAGINDIPQSVIEAAKIDGAGPIRQFVSIIVPLVRRPLLFVLVADTVANFVLFAPVQVLTGGGPQEQSNFLLYNAFRTQFQLSDKHSAAAMLVVLVAVLIVIVSVQFRLLGREEAR